MGSVTGRARPAVAFEGLAEEQICADRELFVETVVQERAVAFLRQNRCESEDRQTDPYGLELERGVSLCASHETSLLGRMNHRVLPLCSVIGSADKTEQPLAGRGKQDASPRSETAQITFRDGITPLCP